MVKTDAQTVRIDLKTFPTNYGLSGKPITNFIAGVILDLSERGAQNRPSDKAGLKAHTRAWFATQIRNVIFAKARCNRSHEGRTRSGLG